MMKGGISGIFFYYPPLFLLRARAIKKEVACFALKIKLKLDTIENENF